MHPNAIDLQAFACGDDAPHVASHLDACEACQAYVARTAGIVNAGALASETPHLAALRALPSPQKSGERTAAKAATVTPIGERAKPSRQRAFTALTLAPFAIAAAALLWMGVRTPKTNVADADGHGIENSANANNRGLAPPIALALNDKPDPDTTFKGGLQLAVVRERNGAQDRFTGPVRVQPGDRLRIEVAIDRTQTILGAVMGEDDSYVELMPAGAREAGTHFSEKATRVDEHPLRGTILVGAPEAVRLARTTHDFTGLRTLPIEWDATP